jgi:hypothetical protein
MPTNVSSTTPTDQLQSPGAGPSRPHPLSALVPPPDVYLLPGAATARGENPACTTTVHQEVELGTYLVPDCLKVESKPLSPLNGEIFPQSGSGQYDTNFTDAILNYCDFLNA